MPLAFLQKFSSPAPRGLGIFHLLCFNLLPFQSGSVSTRGLLFQAFPSLQVKTSFDTFWIHKVSLGEIIWQEGSQKQVTITSLVQGFSGSSSHKAYHWIVPHSFLGAPWEGKPGGAAPGGKPIRPDCPMSPAYNAAYDVAAAEFAAEAESPAADACK